MTVNLVEIQYDFKCFVGDYDQNKFITPVCAYITYLFMHHDSSAPHLFMNQQCESLYH